MCAFKKIVSQEEHRFWCSGTARSADRLRCLSVRDLVWSGVACFLIGVVSNHTDISSHSWGTKLHCLVIPRSEKTGSALQVVYLMPPAYQTARRARKTLSDGANDIYALVCVFFPNHISHSKVADSVSNSRYHPSSIKFKISERTIQVFLMIRRKLLL
jgi:hypothetical protein